MSETTDEVAFWERVFLAQIGEGFALEALSSAAVVAEYAVRGRREFIRRNEAERQALLQMVGPTPLRPTVVSADADTQRAARARGMEER